MFFLFNPCKRGEILWQLENWMPRGSNLPPPAQWNLQGWMSDYYASQRGPNSIPLKEKVEEEMEDVTGGWRYEGKESPPLIRICPKCQGIRRDEKDELSRSNWCVDCKDGKPGPGHAPEGIRPLSVSQAQDAATLKEVLFG